MKENAASLGKSLIEPKRAAMFEAVVAPSKPEDTRPSVAVACSLAISAETVAAAPCHVPKPSGAKIHAIQVPRSCRIER